MSVKAGMCFLFSGNCLIYIYILNNHTMKRIYLILFTAALSASLYSCEEKTAAEKANTHTEEAGDTAKTKLGKAIENEAEKTTKNGSDAH